MLSLRPLGFGAALAGTPPRGICAFVVGNLSFHGFPAICLTRWQPRSSLAEKVGRRRIAGLASKNQPLMDHHRMDSYRRAEGRGIMAGTPSHAPREVK